MNGVLYCAVQHNICDSVLELAISTFDRSGRCVGDLGVTICDRWACVQGGYRIYFS